MRHTDVIVIGAGQAGLAMSHCLGQRGIDHIVLERGTVAHRWRTERWDSLRLLTPNWMSRLPGWRYRGDEPDEFMTKQQLIDCLEDYARTSDAPVVTGAAVHAVKRILGGYHVETTQGSWSAICVVIATGYCDIPTVPDMARHLPDRILQITPTAYRNAGALPDGGVLVVGASASGIQLADEIQRSGRQVILAAGRHTRVPRSYRGRDIMWWMDQAGVHDDLLTDMPDRERAILQPSFQLVGRPDHADLDLATLRESGVQVVGRVTDVDGNMAFLARDLAESVVAAQSKLDRLLTRIDKVADACHAPAAPRPRVITGFESPPSAIDLKAQGIATVIWAVGFKRDYSWLKVPVLDAGGELIQSGGVTASPGLYALGLRFMRRRKSNFLDGVGTDAEEIAAEIQRYVTEMVCAAA